MIRLKEGETIGTQHGLPGEKGVAARELSSNVAASDTPYAFNITVDAKDLIPLPAIALDMDPATALNKDPTNGFWDFSATFTEYWNGSVLHCEGKLNTRSGDFIVNYDTRPDGLLSLVKLSLNDHDWSISWSWAEHSKLLDSIIDYQMLI